MAISTTNAISGPFLTNGFASVFPFTFTAPSVDDVSVLLRGPDGESILSRDLYRVTVNPQSGGSVVFDAPPTNGAQLYVLLTPDFRQQTEFENGSPWRAEPVNKANDRSAARDQALARDLGRAILTPLGESPSVLPLAEERAGKALFFDEEGDTDLITPDDFAEPARESAAEAIQSASLAEGFALLLALLSGGYVNIDDPAPPVGVAEGEAYLYTLGGRFFLARNIGGAPSQITEFATRVLIDGLLDGKFIDFDGGLGKFLASEIYEPGTIGSKLKQIPAVQDFLTALEADLSNSSLFVPDDVTTSVANGAGLSSLYWGPGRLTTADGNKRGKWFSSISQAPAALGNHDSVETAFNGDLSRVPFHVEHRITGAATLGQPATGYRYTPEAYPHYTMLYTDSGHNEATDGNGGRTAACIWRGDIKHYGQGDAVVYNFSGFVAGTKPGATHFLANPAIVGINGDLTAGADGVYLNPREIYLKDAGNDVAAVGDVSNLERTNATGALSCWWGHYRAQSKGAAAVDNVLSFVGPHKNGIDFALNFTQLDANQSAVSLKAGQRIYFNNASTNDNFTDVHNGDYMMYSSAAKAIIIFANGDPALQVSKDQVTATKPFRLATVTASQLPAPSTSNRGVELYVSDANSTDRNATVVGGGSNFVKAYSNGSAWLIA